MNPPSNQAPVDPRQRIEAVDMVRGFALFGVLLVNMYNFGAYSIEWTGPLDRFSFTIMHAVFERSGPPEQRLWAVRTRDVS